MQVRHHLRNFSNPNLRKAKGVWYTPQPVVGFIVRAVDYILMNDFGLAEGLADYSMIERDLTILQSRENRNLDDIEHKKRKIHRVQILDPAAGTGTFLAEAVNHIYDRYRDNQGIWQQYVENHLLPRLNGFEILMASYAVAHLKLDMLLSETGYQHKSDNRLHIYLTNSLEESNKEPRTLFAQWLSNESKEANVIKRDYPVMVMIGNPPYSISSQNSGKWIMSLIADYKKNLNERNIQPLSDDYIKFIRLGQHYIEKNGEGVLGFITNNSFLDGLIHRQMRKNIAESFDKVYIVNLHGYGKKNETAPDGSKDENVFDIMQGVSINIFVKTGKKDKGNKAQILYLDIFGAREKKYETLDALSLSNSEWIPLNLEAPYYFFVPKDFSLQDEYEKGFKIDELFVKYNNGIESGKDDFFFGFQENSYKNFVQSCFNDKDKYCKELDFKDTDNFRLLTNFSNSSYDETKFIRVNYRPFDVRICYYDPIMQRRPAYDIMKNMLKENIALLVPRQVNDDFHHVLVSDLPTNCNLTGTAKKFGSAPIFPLYIYRENMGKEERIVNFKMDIYVKIANVLNLFVCNDENIVKDPKEGVNGVLYPQDLFDYIYSVLHSPSYRERYKEFLKIDFPRIPYPTNFGQFRDLVKKGEELRQLHLMENLPNSTGVSFPQAGSLQVDCYRWEQGRVYINREQYFEGVPESAWNFYIGGYQPAQKWLKDRKGMILSFEDVKHYLRIIYVLQQTEQLMNEIDDIIGQ